MSYKTILVNLATTGRAPPLLRAVSKLSKPFEAHVVAFHVVPMAWIPAASPMDMSGELIELQTRAYQDQAKAIRALFEAAVAKGELRGEWRQVDAKYHDPCELEIAAGNVTDLIVMAGPAKGAEFLPTADTAERVMMEGGRPVLFVPEAGADKIIGGNVLVAWNGSRESARAAFDALPLLQAAKSVHVLAINPDQRAAAPSELPWAGLVAALKRHGVACKGSSVHYQGNAIADELTSQAAADDAGLLVMGGYGHSRLREYVFGGATYEILSKLPVPVLMSH